MKTKLTLVVWLVLFMSSCDKAVDNYIYLQLPDKADAKVYTEDLQNYIFRYDADMGDGWYRYNCRMERTLPEGKLAVVYPASDDNTYDGTEFHLTINAVQNGNEGVYASTAALNKDGEWRIACKPAFAEVVFELKNRPAQTVVRSVTLRLLTDDTQMFHTSCNYSSAAARVTYSDNELRSALSVYGSDNIRLAVFPADFSQAAFQMEVMLDDATLTGTTHVFTIPGKRLQRNNTYNITLDFATEHPVCASYPLDTDYRMSGGVPAELGGVVFAPVNLGFDDVKAPFGATFEKAKISLPKGWRLPTEAEMQMVAGCNRSDHYTVGGSFGYWFGPTALITPADGQNIFLPVGGMADGKPLPAAYWLSDTGKIFYLDTECAEIRASDGALGIVRPVKE